MIETFHIIILSIITLLFYYDNPIYYIRNIAQQILSTSLYLLRLVDNIYNRPAATNPERFSFILQEYLKTTMHGDNGKIFSAVWNWRICSV